MSEKVLADEQETLNVEDRQLLAWFHGLSPEIQRIIKQFWALRWIGTPICVHPVNIDHIKRKQHHTLFRPRLDLWGKNHISNHLMQRVKGYRLK